MIGKYQNEVDEIKVGHGGTRSKNSEEGRRKRKYRRQEETKQQEVNLSRKRWREEYENYWKRYQEGEEDVSAISKRAGTATQ